MGLRNLSYSNRLEKLNLNPLSVRRDLKILKLLFKSINNYDSTPHSWRQIFITKDTRNGLLLESLNTRINFCDKNFFNYCITLFNSLPKCIRNENSFVKFMNDCELFLMNNFKNCN